MEEYFGYNNDKIDEDLTLKTNEIKILDQREKQIGYRFLLKSKYILKV